MTIRWLPEAADDLEAIHLYLTEHLPRFAFSTINEIYRTIQSLTAIPFRGKLRRDAKTYELVLPRIPYIVFYRVEEQTIVILYIRHTAQSGLSSS